MPERLQRKRVVSLNLAALLAGTEYRGTFEERLHGVVAEAQASTGHIILFIDEVHTIVGAGQVRQVCCLVTFLLQKPRARPSCNAVHRASVLCWSNCTRRAVTLTVALAAKRKGARGDCM